jgi:transposase
LALPEKKTLLASESQTKVNLEKREHFLKELRKYKPEDILVLDESGFLLSQRRNYGWSKKGKRIRERRKRRSQRLSMISVVSHKKVLGLMTVEGSVNTDSFLLFLQKLILPNTRKGQVLVLDNWTVHHSRKLQPLLQSYGVHLLYLPPYSPELSPIELFWGWLKQQLNSWNGSTIEAVENGIKEALDCIPDSHCEGWFRHCGYMD